MKRILQLAVLGALFAAGCRPNSGNPTPYTNVTIDLSHNIDGKPLYFDSLMYSNNAGELYSVNNLEYYISGVRFYYRQKMSFSSDTVVYIDARKPYITLPFYNVPEGSIDSVAFYIGIDPAHNIHGKIAPTAQNVTMEWPDAMGGGYHFMKLEGHWKDGSAQPGFAVHLGTDAYLVHAGAPLKRTISAATSNNFSASMNINEWFRSPNIYSFSRDGVYTMGNATLMGKVRDNGADVIQFK